MAERKVEAVSSAGASRFPNPWERPAQSSQPGSTDLGKNTPAASTNCFSEILAKEKAFRAAASASTNAPSDAAQNALSFRRARVARQARAALRARREE